MLYIATDHAGYELKEALVKFFEAEGIEYSDEGAHDFDHEDDYPDFIIPAMEKVAANPEVHRGIVLGGSGQGEAIAANKVKGIRAALYYGGDRNIVKLSRTHNNANVLSLGARFISVDEAQEVIKEWLSIDFSAEDRHARRIQKLSEYENK